MSDMVNHPDHYTYGKVECIDAIETATHGLTGFESYATGTILKYLWRWRHKNGIEDLRKAQWYLERLIKFAEPTTSLAVREVGESFWES